MLDSLVKLKNERNLSDKLLIKVSSLVNILFCISVENNLQYYPPYIFCNCFNEVVLEFWGKDEGLLIFIANVESLKYIKFEKSTDQFDVNSLPEEGSINLEDKQFILSLVKWIAE